jgi:hypothetical protein
MSSSQGLTSLEIISVAVGSSSTDFTFQGRGLTTSTVFEARGGGETQNCIVWFEQGGPGDPSDLNTIVYVPSKRCF